MNAPLRSASHDFDFFVGKWRVHHRRLKVRLAHCEDWLEFEGSCATQLVLGGLGNLDDNVLEVPGAPYRAVTLRSFDLKTNQWAIWWLDGRNPHVLDPPMVGGWENGVGQFYCDDVFEGRPIRARFLWSHSTAETCHWEQAFSIDGGETWETNWVSDFVRVE
jgi:hypothetical protein